MRVDLTIFDFDGTLASSLDGITACMGKAFQLFGYSSPSSNQVRATVGLTLEDSIRALTNGVWPESDIPEVVRTYRGLHEAEAAPRITLYDGVADVLAAIKGVGIKTVLVSNKGHAGLVQLLRQLGISDYFDLMLAADRVQHHKPSAVLYNEHIAPAFPHIEAEDVLVVGDTESDLRFAANIGARSCWAAYGYGHPATFMSLLPTFTISSIDGLRTVLKCQS
jgi:phosphoglycolate phosphatase